MRTLFILRGLPGSGKSTVAAEMIRKEPKRFMRINRDDLRSMVRGPGNNPHERDNDREDLMRMFKDELVRMAFKNGYDVILYDTHLVPTTVKNLHQLAASVGDVKVIEKVISVSIEECIARDAKRTGFAHVGEKIIRDMARGAGLDKGRKLYDKESYYVPRWTVGGPGAAQKTRASDPSLPKAIMCDLDGTLALMGDRSPYDATDCDVKDHPNWPVINTVLAMYAKGHKILFMSGRSSKYRPETIRFIEKYCRIERLVSDETGKVVITNNDTSIPISYELHMRSEGDMRKDSIIKNELFAAHVEGKYDVEFVLDDRDQVVDEWRSMGLTCYQVAPGAF